MSESLWHMFSLTKINTVLVVGHSMYQTHSSTRVDHSLFQKICTFSVVNRLFGTKILMLKQRREMWVKVIQLIWYASKNIIVKMLYIPTEILIN